MIPHMVKRERERERFLLIANQNLCHLCFWSLGEHSNWLRADTNTYAAPNELRRPLLFPIYVPLNFDANKNLTVGFFSLFLRTEIGAVLNIVNLLN